jgi:tRNA threonylcarbamoyladenosine biosynthesis protein TsaE
MPQAAPISPKPTDGILSRTVILPDPSATDRFAEQLAPRLRPGLPVLLIGAVGAGKSHLARAVIRQLCGQMIDVPSPTFTLVQTYDTPRGEVWHADLYRLTNPADADELGLVDAMARVITLVEWPDRLGRRYPAPALTLHLTISGDGRRLELSGPGDVVVPLASGLSS